MIKDSLLIFINKFFINVAIVIGTYLFSHNLSINEYGEYQNFWNQFNTIYAIASLGLVNFILTYTPSNIAYMLHNLKKKQWISGSVVIIVCAILFAILQSSAGLSMLPVILFLIFHTTGIILESVLTVLKKYKILTLVSILYFTAFVGLHFYMIYHQTYNFNQLIIWLLVLAIAKTSITIFVLFYSFKNIEIDQSFKNRRYSKLWLHLYLFDIVQIMFLYADKFFISVSMDPATAAIYQNGTYNIPFLPIVFNAVSGAALMQLAQCGNNKTLQKNILQYMGRMLATFVFPVFFFFFFFSEDFIVFYFSEKYLASIPIFQIALFSLLFRVFNYTLLFKRYEMGGIINKGVVLDVVTLLSLVVPLYYYFGLKGIPLSYAIATLIQCAFYLWHHQKVLKTSITQILPLSNWALKLIVFGALAYGLHSCSKAFSTPLYGMIFSLLMLGIPVLLFSFIEYKRMKNIT